MNDPHDPGDDSGEQGAVRDLIRRSLGAGAPPGDAPNLLSGVQRRIRKRSRGKFFADGWSTTHARGSYALVALVTLLLVVIAYYALGPTYVP